MIQDTIHYYLVSYFERAVGLDKKMIYREFKEIKALVERIRIPVSIELIDCADVNQQGSSFDEWREKQGLSVFKTKEECFPNNDTEAPKINENNKDGSEHSEGKISSLSILKGIGGPCEDYE